jgi:hypothetical protein
VVPPGVLVGVTSIPEWARTAVRVRAHHRCERCGGMGAHWHHRRSRRIVDVHQHCPCNGVWLCGTCHRWVHAHPIEARTTGWIVSVWVDQPTAVPVHTVWGERVHDCHGGFIFREQEQP